MIGTGSRAPPPSRRNPVRDKPLNTGCGTKPGNGAILESTASAVRNKNGEVEKLIIVNRDVSERRLLEKQFLRRKRWKAIAACREAGPRLQQSSWRDYWLCGGA